MRQTKILQKPRLLLSLSHETSFLQMEDSSMYSFIPSVCKFALKRGAQDLKHWQNVAVASLSFVLVFQDLRKENMLLLYMDLFISCMVSCCWLLLAPECYKFNHCVCKTRITPQGILKCFVLSTCQTLNSFANFPHRVRLGPVWVWSVCIHMDAVLHWKAKESSSLLLEIFVFRCCSCSNKVWSLCICEVIHTEKSNVIDLCKMSTCLQIK